MMAYQQCMENALTFVPGW